MDDELDLTEQTPKTFEEETESASASWRKTAANKERDSSGVRVAYGTPTNVIPAPPAITAPPAVDPLDWSPPKIETTAPTQLADASILVDLDDEPAEPAHVDRGINASPEFAVPMIDPSALPPLPKPNMSFARGTTSNPALSLVPRARGVVPPPIRPRPESGAFAMPTQPVPGSGVFAIPMPPPRVDSNAFPIPVAPLRVDSNAIPLSKYQSYPVVQERRFDAADRTFAIRRTGRRMDWGKVAIAGFAGIGLFVGYLAFREDVPSDTKPVLATASARAPEHAVAQLAPPVAEVPTSKAVAEVPTTKTVAEKPTAKAVAEAPAPKAVAELPTAKPVVEAPSTKGVMIAKVAPKPVAEPHVLHVPITSSPDGATVSLVEDGNARVIGTTPLLATLDPAHSYDVVLVLKDHPTTVRHIDGKSEHPITINLATQHPASAPTATVATASTVPSKPAAKLAPAPAARTSPAPTSTSTRPVPVKQAPPPAQHVAAAPVQPAPTVAQGTGVLMVSAKPPCQISIDGKPTKLMTPQNAIAMPAGIHRVTLTNPQNKINWGVDVRIAVGQPTKVIQDFTKKK